MKDQLVRYFLLSLIVAVAYINVTAQSDTLSAAAGDRYVISANAGAVNFVEGSVNVIRKAGKSGRLLKGDMLDVGDKVTTTPDGKAEILLNPGSFLRLGGDSAFEFKTTTLDNLLLTIDRGSAILEVYAADEFKVSVTTPSTVFSLIETGVYRVDVPGNSEARLRVWKGAARVGINYEVAPGRAALATGSNSVTFAKFDRDKKDSLDAWSKERSKELAKLTAKLRREDLRTLLMQGFLVGRWNFLNSFGLWVFDPFFGGYCFLPFGSGWGSPYGYGYGRGMSWWWSEPWNYPGHWPTNTGGGPPPTGGGPTPPASSALRADRSPIPPFIRMEQMWVGGGGGGLRDRGDRSSDSGSSYNPSSSSSSSSRSSSSSSSSSSSTGTKSDPNTGTKP